MFLDEVSCGDALVASLKILDSIKKEEFKIHELMNDFNKFPQVMINVRVKDPNLCLLNDKFIDTLNRTENKLNGAGRILIRPSGTEPVLRIMAEGEDKNLVKEIVNELVDSTKDLTI